MGRGGDDGLRAASHQGVGGEADRAGRVDHVVDQEADPAVDLADDLVHGDGVGHVGVAPLVDDREGASELVGPLVGHPYASCVRRDDDEVLVAVLLSHVLAQQRHGVQVIDGAVEESLDLGGVEVDGHDAGGTGRRVQVGHQPCGDRLTTGVLLVLTGVRVERRHHGDPLRRRALERVDHDQLLHHPLVDGRVVGLDDERVRPSYRLLEPYVDLRVRVRDGAHRHQVDVEDRCHLVRERRVRPAGEQHQSLLILLRQTGAH